jgi:hypothetical protein
MPNKLDEQDGAVRAKKKEQINNDEAIKNLLILSLLNEGVDPKVIEVATGMPEMTIRGRFPMKYFKKTKRKNDEQETSERNSDTWCSNKKA